MSAYGAEQWDRDGEMFDGSYAPLMPRRVRRPALRNHGPQCSGNPTIGCHCDQADKPRPTDRSSRFGTLPLSNQPTPFSRDADADPKVQEARRRAFESQERITARFAPRRAS